MWIIRLEVEVIGNWHVLQLSNQTWIILLNFNYPQKSADSINFFSYNFCIDSPLMAYSTARSTLLDLWCDHTQTDTETQTIPLRRSLRRLKTFLRLLGFIHDSPFTLSISTLSFFSFGVAAPSLVIIFFYCGHGSSTSSACSEYHLKNFELETLFFQATAAGVSLVCFSLSFRKYGLRIFLFVDKYQGNIALFQFDYIPKIDVSFSFIFLIFVVSIFCFCIASAFFERNACFNFKLRNVVSIIFCVFHTCTSIL